MEYKLYLNKVVLKYLYDDKTTTVAQSVQLSDKLSYEHTRKQTTEKMLQVCKVWNPSSVSVPAVPAAL